MQQYSLIENYIKKQQNEAIKEFVVAESKVKYSSNIKQGREIKEISGDKEIVRAYLLTKLVHELGYKPDKIEIEKE